MTVLDNDAGPDGERRPVEGALVALYDGGRKLGEARTLSSGTMALPTPANRSDDQLRLSVEHAEYNSRNLHADGAPIVPDLRRILYGAQ